MLLELDQSTLAYMTAALEGVYKKIPPGKDSSKLRKQIADAMISSAKLNKRTLSDFEVAGMRVLNDFIRSPKVNWFGGWLSS